MINLTRNEGKALLILFKDITGNHNANSLSKKLGISRVGTMKMLKKLEARRLLKSKQLGKAVFYKPTLEDFYTSKIIETLLIAESREHAERWIDEFKAVYKETEIVLLFGSITRNQKKASDVDVVFIFKKGKYDKVRDFVSKKNKTLFKKIHEIPQTIRDLKDNLRDGNKAMLDAVRTGYVLHGQDALVKVIKNVTGF